MKFPLVTFCIVFSPVSCYIYNIYLYRCILFNSYYFVLITYFFLFYRYKVLLLLNKTDLTQIKVNHKNAKKISMPDEMISSIDILPVELMYCIMDYFDEWAIFMSFRNVCRRFDVILNAHPRCPVRYEKSQHNTSQFLLTYFYSHSTRLTFIEKKSIQKELNIWLKY